MIERRGGSSPPARDRPTSRTVATPAGVVGGAVADVVAGGVGDAVGAEVVVVGPDDDVLVGQLAAGDHAEEVGAHGERVAVAVERVAVDRLGELGQLLDQVGLAGVGAGDWSSGPIVGRPSRSSARSRPRPGPGPGRPRRRLASSASVVVVLSSAGALSSPGSSSPPSSELQAEPMITRATSRAAPFPTSFSWRQPKPRLRDATLRAERDSTVAAGQTGARSPSWWGDPHDGHVTPVHRSAVRRPRSPRPRSPAGLRGSGSPGAGPQVVRPWAGAPGAACWPGSAR